MPKVQNWIYGGVQIYNRSIHVPISGYLRQSVRRHKNQVKKHGEITYDQKYVKYESVHAAFLQSHYVEVIISILHCLLLSLYLCFMSLNNLKNSDVTKRGYQQTDNDNNSCNEKI